MIMMRIIALIEALPVRAITLLVKISRSTV